MTSVFVLHHVHVLPEDDEDVKLIGVYSAREQAEAAIARLAGEPGFRDSPGLIDHDEADQSGFSIDEYRLDEDHWTEGFISWTEAITEMD